MSNTKPINLFEKYLTIWVILCMLIGVSLGYFLPSVPNYLSQLEIAHISLPITVLIWLMVLPMMMKIDFTSIKDLKKNPQGLWLTWIVNWLIKPFTMFAISAVFFRTFFSQWIGPELAQSYIAGAVLLGAAPCTAMVFVWSQLVRGNSGYTLIQVATNDLIMLFAFVPIVALLLGVTGIFIPWDTLIYSVVLFIVIPLIVAIFIRKKVIALHGVDYFQGTFIKFFDKITPMGLLLTLILIFSFQGDIILNNSWHIVLIAIPLTIQSIFIFALTYIIAKRMKLPHDMAAPAALIGTSNFFELAVAVSITVFGLNSGATLVTIVGVLVEVPLMLALVRFSNRTRDYFSK